MRALDQRQYGFGILEMTLALALFTMILLFSMRDQQRTARMQVDRAAGEHLKVIQLALQRYLDQNRANLLAGAPIAGIVDAVAPPMAELRAVNALAPSVGDVGPNGLSYQLRVDRLPAACVPATNCVDLQGVMWATTPLMEGAVPQVQRIAVMQSAAGIDAAIASVTNAAQLSGLDGIWPIPNPLGNQPGVIAARAGWGASTDLGAFLRRDGSDAGMVGNLNLNNNRIDNPSEIAAPAGGSVRFTVGGVEAGRVLADGFAVNASLRFQNPVVAGGACVEPGAVGRVSTGNGNGVALCDGGVWRTLAVQAALGDACATKGATATGASGEQIVCIGGIYTSIVNRLPRLVTMAQEMISHGDAPPAIVMKPTCGSGGTPRLVLVPQDPGADPSHISGYGDANRLQMQALELDDRWHVTLWLVDFGNNKFIARGMAPFLAYNLQAVALSQCEY